MVSRKGLTSCLARCSLSPLEACSENGLALTNSSETSGFGLGIRDGNIWILGAYGKCSWLSGSYSGSTCCSEESHLRERRLRSVRSLPCFFMLQLQFLYSIFLRCSLVVQRTSPWSIRGDSG